MKKTFSRRKRLGQCFLKDRNILELEAKLARVKNKKVLEIGAGDGRLTDALLRQNPKKIIAVEKDPELAAFLKGKFKGKQVEIIEGDFLKIQISHADVIVGNIPYYISSDIIFTIKDLPIEHAVLMVQREFAQKMIAKPKDKNYGRLSVTSQIFFEIKLERTVPRYLFRPMPKVDSAIIIMKPTGTSLSQFQQNVIRYLFQHKNKTIRNALLDSKVFEAYELKVLGKFGRRRAKTLSKEECLEIARLLAGQ